MTGGECLSVNGLLCYLSTARHSYTEKALTAVCLSFYSPEKISEAKGLLFVSTNESATRRRGEGKAKADLQDIIAAFRKLDEKNVTIPKFVADSYKVMPPASGFEVLADHLVSFISEFALLKEELKELRAAKEGSEKWTEIGEELRDIKCMLKMQHPTCTVNGSSPSKTPVLFSKCVEQRLEEKSTSTTRFTPNLPNGPVNLDKSSTKQKLSGVDQTCPANRLPDGEGKEKVPEIKSSEGRRNSH